MKTLVYAFVSSRIDYCNSILAGVRGQLLQRLQSLQNAAARLVTGARRSDRILRLFYATCIGYQYASELLSRRPYWYTNVGMAWLRHPYLSTYCEPTSSHGGRCHLRSAESGQLTVPRTRTNYTKTAVLPFTGQSWGTVFQPISVC